MFYSTQKRHPDVLLRSVYSYVASQGRDHSFHDRWRDSVSQNLDPLAALPQDIEAIVRADPHGTSQFGNLEHAQHRRLAFPWNHCPAPRGVDRRPIGDG